MGGLGLCLSIRPLAQWRLILALKRVNVMQARTLYSSAKKTRLPPSASYNIRTPWRDTKLTLV